MAIVVENTQTAGWSIASSITVTKPTGLEVGDLMLAQIGQGGNNRSISVVPTGFTLIRADSVDSGGGDVAKSTLYYKVADSSDVAASNFQWTFSATEIAFGSIIRISGVQEIDQNNGGTGAKATSQSLGISITPHISNFQFIFALGADATAATVSGYAIATNNPTWTELYDSNTISGDKCTIACAYGDRPEGTATGNVSFTWSVSSYTAGQIVSVAVSTFPVSVSDTASLSESVPLTAEYTTSVSDTVSTSDDIPTNFIRTDWTEETKPSDDTWTNEDLIEN